MNNDEIRAVLDDPNFDKIRNLLENLWEDNERTSELFYEVAGFNKAQKQLIGEMIVTALQSYHLQFSQHSDEN